MGQKVNPIGLRLGINRTWDSRWFARKEYGNLLLDDLGLRKFLQRRLSQAGLSRVVIERAARRTRITLHSARPGVVIGKKGSTSKSSAPISPRSRIAKSVSISLKSANRKSTQSWSPTASRSSWNAASPFAGR